MSAAHMDARDERIAALEAEVVRLADLLATDAADRMAFQRIEVVDGKIQMTLEDAQGMMQAYAAAAFCLLDGANAPNYCEMQLAFPAHPERLITLTLQRHLGKTPHALRQEAERRAERAERTVQAMGRAAARCEDVFALPEGIQALFAKYEREAK